MRLLHLDQSDDLTWTEFVGGSIPPYGILSHRWSTEEVSYEDLVNGTLQDKDEGYRKIAFCAEKAAEDGLEYFWIDTCCINKDDHRERSLAVNAMFSYYSAATRCYVYLSDVIIDSEEDAGVQTLWEQQFRTSDWHTRGWTLQELIAPPSLEFFSAEGWCLGSRMDLKQMLFEVTGIPHAVLQSGSLEGTTKEERITWARNRITTEPEDSAYCLLGILEVAMPLTYGEGKRKAMQRLEMKMRTDSAADTIPFSRHESFIGRGLELRQLESELRKKHTSRVIGIVGEGGTGKTQLALELAYRAKDMEGGISVFWLDAGDMQSLYIGYSNIARVLRLPGWADEPMDIRQLVNTYLEREETGKWLLIVDNIQNVIFGSRRLMRLLPRAPSGSIVFTATDRAVALAMKPAYLLSLQCMTTAEALEMAKSSMSTTSHDQGETMLLVDDLSHLPLAIAQAAAYVKGAPSTIHEYRIKLGNKHGHGAFLDGHDHRSYSEIKKSPVEDTLLISLAHLAQQDSKAADYLSMAACLDRKDIPIDLLDIRSSVRDDAIRALQTYALIVKRPAEASFDVHRLVHLSTKKYLQRQNLFDHWVQETASRLPEMFPDDNHGNRSKWRRLLPHMKCVLSCYMENGESEMQQRLEWMYANALYSDGRWQECEKLYERAVERSQKTAGEQHPDTLICMSSLASVYMNQGRWEEAELLTSRVLQASLIIHGVKPADKITYMANYASVQTNRGRIAKAEELQVEILNLSVGVLGKEHADTLASMVSLAATYRQLGRSKKAEALEEQVVKLSPKVLGAEHPDTLMSMANLAMTYASQSRWREAEELETRVMETSVRVLGEEHPDTARSMANLATIYAGQKKWEQAEHLSELAVRSSARTIGQAHPITLTSMINLASLYRDRHRWEKAHELELQVLRISQEVLGKEHPDTLASMANLVTTYWQQGQYEAAESLELKLMKMRVRALGEEHPDSLDAMANLASTYVRQRQWDQAQRLSARVIKIATRVLGEEHPITMRGIASLAASYRNGRG